ncbi:molecular chaperone [Salmonella enterica subsp. diarizonae]|nr:molecular chaperone [Salmonella enterica subsp. diarizonae]
MKTYLSVVLAVLMTCMTAHAAVNIDRTRLVFNERDKAVSLKIENESKKLPYLAYAWVTDSQGQKNDDFFIALPPIQRLEPGAWCNVSGAHHETEYRQTAAGQGVTVLLRPA